MSQFPYKSYCWGVGTTSFRTVEFNVQIERQLALLDEFWNLTENADKSWRELQHAYYCFIQEHDFVKGNAPNTEKDAREKTSGLKDIGLADNKRRLTSAGKALLDISQRGDFKSDNLLQIPSDSYIYLKQLLKTSKDIDGNIVRPFVVTAYVLLQLKYLTDDEFTYLLPLCTTAENTATIINGIKELRKEGIVTVDQIITSRLMSMINYNDALDYFLTESVTENVITAIGMNRKSGSTGEKVYDKSYYLFYKALYDIVLNRNNSAVLELYELSRKINNNPGKWWRHYLFSTTSRQRLEHDGLEALNDVPLLRATNEHDFKRLFFEQMHLFKAKANLSDYADLNRRYFKTTDTVIFADRKVEFDVLPRCWLYSTANDLLSIAFTKATDLAENVELSDIAKFLAIDEQQLYSTLQQLYGITVTTAADADKLLKDERYKRFNSLIDERFDRTKLIDLFAKFEQREDEAIRQAVTNNADIPTIFEYILGIAWYLISDRCGDVLNYMNLSLEADLLPRTHAKGGNADIEYIYEQTSTYPAHTLLLEATLTTDTTQRRAEIEPVSRHLGDYILSFGDENTYCIFVSTYLHHNTISDFRNRKTYEHYTENYKDVVSGLKILPLATSELRTILKRNIGYDKLYSLFEKAYLSNEPVPTWYNLEIEKKVSADL